MNKRYSVIAVVLALAATGCATYQPADTRHGYVNKLYAVGERPPGLPDCLAALDSAQLAGTRFVALQYGTMRLRKYAVALAPTGMPLAPRDKVAFVPATCLGNEVPRITGLVAG